MQPPQPTSPGGRERRDYDQALKWLLTRAHDAFLELVAPGYTWRGERSGELPAVGRRADLVWEVTREDGKRRLLHIELQVKVEDNIGERLAEYMLRLWLRDHLPVRSIVVFLRETPHVPASPFVIPWEEDHPSLRAHFEVVRLWEVPQERVLDSPSYDLWPLAGLMAGATAETTVTTAERLVALPVPVTERDDLIGLLFGLSGIRTPRETLLSALRRSSMLDELLRESSIIQAFIEEGEAKGRQEGEAKGRQEGEAKGRQEGEAKGRQEGERQMARIALEGRFGPLPDDLLASLNAADETTLRALVAQIVTISLEQVRERLGIPSPG